MPRGGEDEMARMLLLFASLLLFISDMRCVVCLVGVKLTVKPSVMNG